jgi:pimeloyl-ACP methyl ester carboxylesterase
LTEFMIKAKMDDVVPEKSAATWKGKPALVIHGDADKLLDISHAKRVAQSANCPLWVVKGANHACCSEVDLSGYVDKLLSFAKQSDLH